MNRILFEREEICGGVATCAGARAEHILNVLHGEVGQILKTGEIDGPIGTGKIIAIPGSSPCPPWAHFSEMREQDRAGNVPTGAFRRNAPTGGLTPLVSRPSVQLRVSHAEASLRPWCDLVLAPPRPRVMKRLLPQLATLGVGKIVLVGAEKTEKDFWGATLLKEENYRPLFIDGLMQAGTSILPELLLRRNFRRFLRDELDALFPTANRIVAHPYLATQDSAELRTARPLFAIGPEGGWTETEVALLQEHGFRGHSLGPRILKTDTATVALLSRFLPSGSSLNRSVGL